MTVKELIDQLKKVDQSLEARTTYGAITKLKMVQTLEGSALEAVKTIELTS